MNCPTIARRCQNCYHTWHACKEGRDEVCLDYEHRQQGIHRQLRLLEEAKAHTLLGLAALLILMASPVVWAYL